jgi:hypothetical protein
MTHDAQTVRLSPREMVEYRAASLAAAARINAVGTPPAKVMHEAGQFLNFMLYGLPVDVEEFITQTKIEG